MASKRSKAKAEIGRRRRFMRAYTEMHYQLRTEGDTPARQALSIWLGTAVGCIPLYGIHLLLCAWLGKLLRLSRIKAYLAAHVNNPLTFPLVIYVELGIGHWVRIGSWPELSLAELREIGMWNLGLDLLVGTVLLGLVLGAALALVTYVISTLWQVSRFRTQLREATSKRYVEAGILAWEFVRGKLRYDPIYKEIMRLGVLPDGGRLLDLGCGRAILLSLIATARGLHEQGEWSPEWPPPPGRLQLIGVEQWPHLIDVARTALGEEAELTLADLDEYELPFCRVAVLIDVLHHMTPAQQRGLVHRVAHALERGGLVIVREPDADGGLRFHLTRLAERIEALFGRQWRRRTHYRGAASWVRLLEETGLTVEQTETQRGTPGAKVLIRARRAEGSV